MADNQVEVKIIPLAPEHARDAAQLHIEGIHMGFISSLGVNFVTALYKAIAESKESFGYVATKDCKVVGFASFTTDLNRLYKSLVYKSGLKFFVLLFRRMFSMAMIRKVFETLFYPSRVKKMDLPEAELLSIAVSVDQRGKGLARKLIETGFQECCRRGIPQVKVLVADSNQSANRLYQQTGFQFVTKIENHGVVSNVYVVPTDYFENP